MMVGNNTIMNYSVINDSVVNYSVNSNINNNISNSHTISNARSIPTVKSMPTVKNISHANTNINVIRNSNTRLNSNNNITGIANSNTRNIKDNRANELVAIKSRNTRGPPQNSIISKNNIQPSSIQINNVQLNTNTNFNYYRSGQKIDRPTSEASKSSIRSISNFFKKFTFSRTSSRKDDFLFEPMFQQADYQGWLWTRLNKESKWKKRWIILSKDMVYFLKEPKVI